MRYIYAKAGTLERQSKIGDGDCVALVQYYAHLPHHLQWKEGPKVLDLKDIKPGTAIATFVHGRYQSKDTGNHAAFFLRHGAPGTGFWVMDQWKTRPGHGQKKYISSRFIDARHKKQRADGSWPDASDNADAFSVIE
jgi:hypothetical protein